MEELKDILLSLQNILSFEIFELGGNKVSLMSLMSAMTILFLTYRGSKLIEKFVSKNIKNRFKDIDAGLATAIEKFTGYLVLTVGFVMVLDTLGIGLKSLAAVSAVFMVGIGFGLQNIAQNFISGLILLMERPVKEGDLIEVDGVEGRIIDIRARATVVQTRDDVAIIVPNSKLISDNVINDHHLGPNIRVRVGVGVAYGSDVELVKKVLTDVGKNHPYTLKGFEVQVLFKNFGDSSLDFELACWTSSQWEKEKMMSDLRYDIDKAFRKNSISIPFPQRDIHIQKA